MLDKVSTENDKLKHLLKDIPSIKAQVKNLDKLYGVQLNEHADMRKEFRYELFKVK